MRRGIILSKQGRRLPGGPVTWFVSRHSEPVTDVTGVGIRILKNTGTSHFS